MADSIEQQVIDTVEAKLAEITTANSYEIDVREVLSYDALDDHAVRYPCLLLIAVSGDYDENVFAGKHHNTLTLNVHALLDGMTAPQSRTSQFIADVRKALFELKPIEPAPGDLIHNIEVRRSFRLLPDGDPPREFFGAVLEVVVDYRDTPGDPYTDA